MNFRQKTLLGLLSAFGGHLPSTDFQKYLFLYTREFQQDPFFEFGAKIGKSASCTGGVTRTVTS